MSRKEELSKQDSELNHKKRNIFNEFESLLKLQKIYLKKIFFRYTEFRRTTETCI